MKNLYKTGVAAVTFWLITVSLIFGQSPDQTPTPQEPVLPRAPEGTWTVTYKYKPSSSSPAPNGANSKPASSAGQITTLRVEKKGAVYHVVTTEQSGVVSENWIVSGIEIFKAAGSKSYVRLAPGNPFYMDFTKSDFDEISWIGMDNYKGVKDGPTHAKVFDFEVKNVDRRQTEQEHVTIGDIGALLEQGGAINPKSDKKKAVAQYLASQFGDTVSHAQLDVATQLPVIYDDGTGIRTYTFSSDIPPNAPLDILQLMQAMREQVRRTYVRASPP